MARQPADRDRDAAGRPRSNRPRDALGRPLAREAAGAPELPVPSGPGEPVHRTPTESLELAQLLLEAGRPFHAHEVLEDCWKAAPEPERDLWRGLAQLAVGLTHAARGNPSGAGRLLRRASATLTAYEGLRPQGVDVHGVRRWAAEAADAAEADRPLPGLPRLSPGSTGPAPTPTGPEPQAGPDAEGTG